ncbi:hypothetical protein H0H87_012362 [Tephrocybe sp. NHM501043]|nr:hypothetical protein H0H87_012362 [Tephrocybe sp. NHM501043]
MASSDHSKNPERVAAGLRASIKNPKVSEEAKAHAKDRLQELNLSKEHSDTQHSSGTAGHTSTSHDESNRVLGGYKATLHNAHASEKAKEHAREILSAHGYTQHETDEKLHQARVIAGYKAALHNPKVSDEAKEHAREYLKEHEEL